MRRQVREKDDEQLQQTLRRACTKVLRQLELGKAKAKSRCVRTMESLLQEEAKGQAT